MKHPEDHLQMLCAEFLDLKGLFWFHPPNGGYRNIREAARFKRMGVKSGASDILIFNSPHLLTDQKTFKYKGLAVELKCGKNKPTEAQKAFMEKLESHGWLTHVTYDFDSFKEIIDELYPVNNKVRNIS